MNWILLAILPGALWSVSNYIDKILIEKYFKGGGLGALMIVSSLVGVLVLPVAFFLSEDIFAIGPIGAVMTVIGGMLAVLMLIPYFNAMDKAEPMLLIPIFQTIPVFAFILSFIFLGEILSKNQIIASIIITASAILIGFDFKVKKMKYDPQAVGLMLIASFIAAVNTLIFKKFALDTSLWTVVFWEYLGFFILGLGIYTFNKPYRIEFHEVILKNSTQIIGVNFLNEVVNIVARVVFNTASLLAPLTLAWVMNGTQPVFIFIYGLLLTVFAPKLYAEEINKRILFQKAFFICLILLGIWLLSF